MSTQVWVAGGPRYCCNPFHHCHPRLQRSICSKSQQPSISWNRQNRILAKIRAKVEDNVSAESPPVLRPVASSLAAEDNALQTVSVEEDGVSVEGVIRMDKQQPSRPPSGRIAALVGGDVLALLVFAAIGRLSHGLPVLDWETFHTADPFIAGWLLGAYFLGGYESRGLGSYGVMKAVVAATQSWAVGIPIGLAIRGVAAGHIPEPAFILVSMGSTFVMLVGWRAVFNALFPNDEQDRKKNDIYRKGSPFEFFQILVYARGSKA